MRQRDGSLKIPQPTTAPRSVVTPCRHPVDRLGLGLFKTIAEEPGHSAIAVQNRPLADLRIVGRHYAAFVTLEAFALHDAASYSVPNRAYPMVAMANTMGLSAVLHHWQIVSAFKLVMGARSTGRPHRWTTPPPWREVSTPLRWTPPSRAASGALRQRRRERLPALLLTTMKRCRSMG